MSSLDRVQKQISDYHSIRETFVGGNKDDSWLESQLEKEGLKEAHFAYQFEVARELVETIIQEARDDHNVWEKYTPTVIKQHHKRDLLDLKVKKTFDEVVTTSCAYQGFAPEPCSIEHRLDIIEKMDTLNKRYNSGLDNLLDDIELRQNWLNVPSVGVGIGNVGLSAGGFGNLFSYYVKDELNLDGPRHIDEDLLLRLFTEQDLAKSEVMSVIARLDLSPEAERVFIAAVLDQHQAELTQTLQEMQEKLGIQLSTSSDTRFLAALIYKSLRDDKIHEIQQAAIRETLQKFDDVMNAFGALAKIGNQLGNKYLVYVGQVGVNMANIFKNIGLLTGSFGLPQSVGMAALNPAVGIITSIFSLGSLFFGSRSSASQKALRKISKQIGKLHRIVQLGFNQTWDNQHVIAKTLVDELLPITIRMQKTVLTQLTAMGKDLKERIDRNHHMGFEELHVKVRNLKNVPPEHLKERTNEYLGLIALWLKISHDHLSTQTSFDETKDIQPLESIQHFVFKALQYDKDKWDDAFNPEEVVNIGLFNQVLAILEDIHPFKEHLDPEELSKVKNRFKHLTENTMRFIRRIRSSDPLYDNIRDAYVKNAQALEGLVLARFIETRKSQGDKYPGTLQAAFPSVSGQSIDFQQLLAKNDHLVQFTFGLCFLSSLFHQQIAGLVGSEEILTSPFDFASELAEYDTKVSIAEENRKTLVLSTEEGPKEFSAYFSRGVFRIYIYDLSENKWELFTEEEKSDTRSYHFHLNQVLVGEENYLSVCSVESKRLHLRLFNVKTKECQEIVCPEKSFFLIKRESPVLFSQFVQSDDGDVAKFFFLVRNHTKEEVWKNPKKKKKGKETVISPITQLVSYDFQSKKWSESRVIEGLKCKGRFDACLHFDASNADAFSGQMYVFEHQRQKTKITHFPLEEEGEVISDAKEFSAPVTTLVKPIGSSGNFLFIAQGRTKLHLSKLGSEDEAEDYSIQLSDYFEGRYELKLDQAQVIWSQNQYHLLLPVLLLQRGGHRMEKEIHFLRVSIDDGYSVKAFPSRFFIGGRQASFKFSTFTVNNQLRGVFTYPQRNTLYGGVVALEPGTLLNRLEEVNQKWVESWVSSATEHTLLNLDLWENDVDRVLQKLEADG